MSQPENSLEHPTEQPTSNGLAVASLVLGATALLTCLFLIGGIFGLIGAVLGILHLKRSTVSRGLAKWGICLSSLGILASVVLFGLYFALFDQIKANSAKYDDFIAQWVGTEVSDLTLTTVNGEIIQLSEAKGRRVIIDVWATWCPPCVAEIPHFNDLRKEFTEDELLIVGICVEELEIVQRYLAKNEINYLVTAEDPELPDPFGAVMAYPTTFFIDRNGVIQHISIGYEDLDTLREYATGSDYVSDPG